MEDLQTPKGNGRRRSAPGWRTVRQVVSVGLRAAPALLGLVVTAAVAAAALAIGAGGLRSAEEVRITSRERLVEETAKRSSFFHDNQLAADMIATLPPSPTDASASWSLFEVLRANVVGPASQAVVLLGRDGRVLAASPAGMTLDASQLGPAWDQALRGSRGTSDVFVDRGEVSSASLVPVGGPSPWAVVVQVHHARDSVDQGFAQHLGGLNDKPGGLAVVDRRGVASQSWDLSDLGRPLLPADELARLINAGSLRWTAGRDGRETVLIGRVLPSGYAVVFEQATDDLLGDLRAAQRQRDRTLLAVLTGTMLALVVFQVGRERAARRAARRLATLLEHCADLIVVCDQQGQVHFASPALHTLLGHHPGRWVGRYLADLAGSDDGGRLTGLLADPGSGPLLDVPLHDIAGDAVWFDIEARSLGADHPDRILLTGHDARARRAGEEDVRRQATHDGLTGLPNRTALSARFDALAAAGGPPFAFLYLDLDGFKPVNDRFGHEAGDHLLTTVAARFAAVVDQEDLVCRLGGDEFGILVEQADEQRAVALADRLLEAARVSVPIGAQIAFVDASIGIALARPGHERTPPEEILRRADQAMYEAKQTGRGRCCVFTGFPPAPGGVARGAASGGRGLSSAVGGVRAVAGAKAIAATAPGGRGGPDPTPPAPAGPRRRRRRSALVPALVAAGVVAGIAAVGQVDTIRTRTTAEARLDEETLDRLPPVAATLQEVTDPDATLVLYRSLPWAFDGGPVDQAIVQSLATAPLYGPGTVVGLARPDGTVLASAPAGRRISVGAGSAAWAGAAAGRVGVVPEVDDPDLPRVYFLVPLGGDHQPAAIMVLGISLRTGVIQRLTEQLSSLGSNAGMSTIDARGVVLLSWDPALLGRRIADPDRLARLAPGQAQMVSDDPNLVVVATPYESMSRPAPVYTVLSQPTEEYYRDLRTGLVARDLGLLAVVLVAVAGLAWVNLRRERSARRSEEWLDTLLHQAHDIVAVVDADGRVTFVSSALTGLLSCAPSDWTDRPLSPHLHPGDEQRMADLLAGVTGALGRPGRGESISDVRLVHADGSHRWFDIDAVGVDRSNDILGTVLTCHEVSFRRALKEQLIYQATHDPLTGLPNRSVFANRLEDLSGTSAATTRAPFAILYIDLDRFKPVNDELGHDAGDLVLRVVATRLQSAVRISTGPVGETSADVVCRLGGDEFVVLLPDATEAGARAAADRILEAIREPIAVNDTEVRIDATIGIALAAGDTDNPSAIVRQADHAMYQAKAAGRSGYLVFTPT
jgi:diguanylate cyclase (GGDEF)-like protein/PAS domain S-box-containing protein